MMLSFYRRIKEASTESETHTLMQKGLDLSHHLARGAAVFVGGFEKDITGIRFDTETDVRVHGAVRIVVEPE